MESAADLVVRSPPPWRAALRDSGSVGLALVPLGLAFGAVLTHAGLDWWWATVFTTLIYAGSFEFLLIGLVTVAAPLAAIGLSAFLVNVRHVFYALSFPLHRVRGRAARTYSTFALTDEAYALTTTERSRKWPGTRILWVQLFLHLFWVGGATAGGLLGSLIPDSVVGLEFAMTALFAVLAIDAVRERRGDVPTPVLAVLSAVAARLLFPGEMLMAAFVLFTTGLIVRYLATGRSECDA
ncbi:AzlC family ABC transporter permease [Prauserella cavernicola]|uniref:AzlC family ABC transporter permease n=1 Tax=Prauserella cavernicola TaxID=2800127 RepID=A0A934QVQ1_9PSEU|nr:AzlC family ABC transporter permease [Prauserella cavernicola]MBK1787082.1 AzlC family ABC transporter permease [Prauserella cavernicola]